MPRNNDTLRKKQRDRGQPRDRDTDNDTPIKNKRKKGVIKIKNYTGWPPEEARP